jgi:ubiquinone/menaquinone biosynthesis C-methylase UbiE
MSELRQTRETLQADFDRIALLAAETWNHNAHYHQFLLSHVPKHCQRILEIGCGTGEFARLLAQRAEEVLALDLSPQMIRVAQQSSEQQPNINFVLDDVLTFDLPEDHFDCIASLTTFHHLPMETILRKVREALKPKGIFLCLDLYQRSNVRELLSDIVAFPASSFLRLVKTGRPRPSAEIREAYAQHDKTDAFLTLPQIQRICAVEMPGALVRQHLFWRYSIVWTKNSNPDPLPTHPRLD